MKTISKKQFQAAVKKVLNGGKSILVTSYETKPFYWTRSKGRMRLNGTEPNNSKYLRNDGKGGKASDVYLVCQLANGYKIEPTKSELKAIEKANKIKEKQALELKKIAKQKRQQKANELKEKATSLGFKSVSALKKAQKYIDTYNSERFDRANKKRLEEFTKLHGEFLGYKIQHRVLLAKIELQFDCEYKKSLI